MDKPLLCLPEQLPANAPILVALSGGADSTLLLHLLAGRAKECGSRLYAVHVHHGIRGGEADRDLDFCRQVCRALHVPLFAIKVNVPALAKTRGQSTELAAREARYRHFARLMKRHDIHYLATAHHADDNLETLLFRLCRGTGTQGLRGIPAISVLSGTDPKEELLVFRPLLHLTKREILDACRDMQLAFVTDSTNTCDDYARNRIRSHVIPALETLFAHPQHAAARLSRAATEDCEALETMAAALFEEHAKSGKISTELLRSLPTALAKRLIVLLFDGYAKRHRPHRALMPEAVHIEAVLAQVRSNRPGSISLPGNLAAHVDHDGLCITEDKLPAAQPYLVPLCQGFCEIEGADIGVWAQFPINTETVTRFDTNVYNLYTEVRVRFDTIRGVIFLRPVGIGDTVLSGGMHKKIRKLYGQSGTPLALRPRLPLLTDADGVLAVPGICIRDGAGADPTHPTLTVRIYLKKSFDT